MANFKFALRPVGKTLPVRYHHRQLSTENMNFVCVDGRGEKRQRDKISTLRAFELEISTVNGTIEVSGQEKRGCSKKRKKKGQQQKRGEATAGTDTDVR